MCDYLGWELFLGAGILRDFYILTHIHSINIKLDNNSYYMYTARPMIAYKFSDVGKLLHV